MLTPVTISRDPTTGTAVLAHNIVAGTFSAAPTLATDGFTIRRIGAAAFDSFEMTFSYDATADATTTALIKPWFLVPDHAPAGTAEWLSGKDVETIRLSAQSDAISSPVVRIKNVPAAATKMYLQVVAITGTAPVNLFMVVYGLSGASGGDNSSTVYAQGVNFGTPSALLTFGDPAAMPPHSTAIAGDILAAAAQAEALGLAGPAGGKVWQKLQIMLRWTVAPAAPVPGAIDMLILVYWTDGVVWHSIHHPAKYIDDLSTVADMQTFTDFTTVEFPTDAIAFAVGCAGYVDGELFVDLIAKA